jgi:hypothetical protein
LARQTGLASGPTAQGAQQRVAADRERQPGREAGAGTAAQDQAEVMRQAIEP